MTVYLRIPGRSDWCVLASAHPGGLITTACGARCDYVPVRIATVVPVEQRCGACGRGDTPAEPDAITELADLVKEAGGTLRLYGKPVTAEELRSAVEVSALTRLVDAVIRSGEDDAVPEPVAHEGGGGE